MKNIAGLLTIVVPIILFLVKFGVCSVIDLLIAVLIFAIGFAWTAIAAEMLLTNFKEVSCEKCFVRCS